jgi:RES domain-containing protein
MTSGWRIVRASRVQAAFTGEGPRQYGARWNSSGVTVVYVSEHQSTATLEVFANRTPFIPDKPYKAFYLEWPDDLTEFFPLKHLPSN